MYLYNEGKLKFHRFVKINRDRPSNMQLKVRYLKWSKDSWCPLGVVVDEIPLGLDFDSAMTVLAINCHIRQRFPAGALAEVDEAVRHHSVGNLSDRHQDFTDVQTFTIDGEKAVDLDDAVSLLTLDNDTYWLGIHIADVACYIEKGSCIDEEALKRLETFYRDDADDPLIPMLPHRLSSDLCSLLPDYQRPVMSFWYKVQRSTGHVVDHGVRRTYIKSARKFTYREVDDVLGGKNDVKFAEFDDVLRQLFGITDAWSMQRGRRCTTAKDMVRELMIQVNETATSLVVEKFPDCVPLYVSQTPISVEPGPIVGDATSEAAPPDVGDRNGTFLLLKPMWYKIMQDVVAGRFPDARALLLDVDRHHSDWWRHLDWSEDDSQKIYRCSGSVSDSALPQKNKYLRVTAPIRRYMDLVGMRLLIAAVEDHAVSPYTKEEVVNLCQHTIDRLGQKNKFEHEIRVLRRAVELKNKAAVVFPYVSSFDESAMSLRFPSITPNRAEIQDLQYNGLDLVDNPVVETSVMFKWHQRIYDMKYQIVARRGSDEREVTLPNSDEQYCFRLPTSVWRSIIEMAQYSNAHELERELKSVHNMHIYEQMMRLDALGDTAVTAEMFNKSDEDFREHFVRFSLGKRVGSLAEVQLTAEVKNGMLRPTVQLFCVTPKLAICVEHRQQALRCFSGEVAEPASHAVYSTVEKYQQAWLPVVSMEAANSAVDEGGAVICGARVKWWKEDGGVIRGRIQLDCDYCKRRQISFYPMNARYFQEDYKLLPEERRAPNFRKGANEFDYLCIRYTGCLHDEFQDAVFGGKFPVEKPQFDGGDGGPRRKTYAEMIKKAPPKGRFSQKPRQDSATVKSPSWVGHAVTTHVSKFSRGKTKMINVHFRLRQHSSDFPKILLSKGLYIDCTVEWIPKLTPHQYVYFRLCVLLI